MNLGSLIAPRGARRERKRFGKGEGSGHGGTSGRGHKGQKARAGGFHKRGFEGGQMPLVRRLPKRGFVNPFSEKHAVVNIGDFKGLKTGTVIDEKFLMENRFVNDRRSGIKVLGDGELTQSLVFRGLLFSASARKKIEKAGGRIEEAKA